MIKIEERKNGEKLVILSNGETWTYETKGPQPAFISGYPYPDFLWLSEVEPGDSYTLTGESSRRGRFSLESVYSLVRAEPKNGGFLYEFREEGRIDHKTREAECSGVGFERSLVDVSTRRVDPEAIEKREYEDRRMCIVTTRIGTMEERVYKTQYFDGENYYKTVRIETSPEKNPRDNAILWTHYYPSRMLLDEFFSGAERIDLRIIERCLWRRGLGDQGFEKLVYVVGETGPVGGIRMSEVFTGDGGTKTLEKMDTRDCSAYRRIYEDALCLFP